ncbi:MAG: J domain-containing protein [Chryseolinea sp.]
MDPYEILGVNRSDSPEGIRAAYRRLVKQYHPDINSSPDAVQMTALINQAYDLITSKQESSGFSEQTASPEYEFEEDPVEAYKRAYKARKFKEAKAKKAAWLRKAKGTYALGRFFSFPMALLSLIVILDFFLPTRIEYDYPTLGYQKVIHSKNSSYIESYMRTPRLDVEVPDVMHLNYDYEAKKKEPILLEYTSILSSLKRVGVRHGSYFVVYDAPTSPYAHSFFFVLPYLILGLSIVYVVKKEYNPNLFPFCMFPLVMGIILLMKIMMS